jgi:glycopeptide antibiotics resistance protein
LWWGVAALIALWLYWMTLRPQATVSADLTPITATAASQGLSSRFVIGFLGNIAVFVPWGAAVALALNRRAWWHMLGGAIGSGALLSASIELLQMAVPGRVTAWDDWALNTLGAAFGAIVVYWGSVWLRDDEGQPWPPASL